MIWSNVFTLGWMLACGVLAIIIKTKGKTYDYERYVAVRFWLGIPFSLAAIVCVWAFAYCDIFESNGKAMLGPWTIAGIIFWVLFPPIWFFLEYFAAESGTIAGAKLDQLKTYADFASKIWAAFLVLYTTAVAQQIDSRKEAVKAAERPTSATIQPNNPSRQAPHP
jgi:hypothetical protein